MRGFVSGELRDARRAGHKGDDRRREEEKV